MVGSFLNLGEEDDNDDETVDLKLGSGIKRKSREARPRPDSKAVAEAGRAHGFDRSTQPSQSSTVPRRGRPPLNEEMTYWRIYVSPDLRNELNALRDQEGRRLNDLLADMLDAYKRHG